MDVDLNLESGGEKIFIVISDERIYVSAGGLSFVDILYSENFFFD